MSTLTQTQQVNTYPNPACQHLPKPSMSTPAGQHLPKPSRSTLTQTQQINTYQHVQHDNTYPNPAGKLTQSHTISLLHFFRSECFVVSCLCAISDESGGRKVLTPADRQWGGSTEVVGSLFCACELPSQHHSDQSQTTLPTPL